MAPVGQTIAPNSSIGDDLAFPIPKSAVQATSAVPRQLNRISSSSYIACIVLIFATSYFNLISAQGSIVASAQAVANFSVSSTSYNCSSNMICLGGAHAYTAGAGLSGIPDIPEGGRLSLIQYNNNNSLGIAYYNHPVKFLDLSSNRSASFSTNFTIDVRHYLGLPGDGMTFLISANNSYTGSSGGWLAIFDDVSYSTPFRSIVVEFDTYYDQGYPINDVNANHVSFDFSNITGMAPVDAMDINVNLTDENTKYAWIDYSSETLLLEVRVSYNNSRPTNPLSSYKLNLVDFVQENMWVGFSSASGSTSSNFYIGDWAFESYGIPVPSLFPAQATPPSTNAPKGGKSGQNKLGITVGISVGIVSFFLACVFAALLVWQRKFCSRGHLEGLVATEEDLMKLEGMPERFSYKHLSVATRAFSEEMKLGQGGFGSVYRGVLPSLGIPVAVKKINSDSNQGEKEFMAEVSIISRLRHRNLIQLQGWCKDAAREKYLLVYELMPNGSLDKVLFGLAGSPSVCLSWEQRFNIVTGTAAALDYLHQGWKRQVIHRDVKSSNIMLDQEWNAKLGDFGLARLVDHQRAATTTIVAGTYGYIAPEAATSGRFTEKTDVYAFGAVVLEIACGRRAFSVDFPPEEFFLVDWVWHCLSAGVLLNTVDERLVDYDTYWIKVVLIVGLWCSHPNPLARPSMRHVVQVLAGDVPVPSIPASKPAPVFSSDPPNISIDSLLGRKSRNGAKSRSGSISLVSMKSFDSAQASALKFSAPSSISNL